MLKYTVFSKDGQGNVLFNQKIEGKQAANKVFDAQKAREDTKLVRMTRWVVTQGYTETVKGYIK